MFLSVFAGESQCGSPIGSELVMANFTRDLLPFLLPICPSQSAIPTMILLLPGVGIGNRFSGGIGIRLLGFSCPQLKLE